MPSGDTFSSLVTKYDTSKTRCVTPQVPPKTEVTEMVTHMTYFYPRVLCARVTERVTKAHRGFPAHPLDVSFVSSPAPAAGTA